MEALWCIYTSENYAIIGSDKSLSPVKCQAIIQRSANKLKEFFNQTSNIFIEWNAFENVVCKMATILSLN